jgi:glucokinase
MEIRVDPGNDRARNKVAARPAGLASQPELAVSSMSASGPPLGAAQGPGADGGWPRPWLLADIGGTNARFGWLAQGGDEVAQVATLSAADYAGPAQAAQAYLAGLEEALGAAYRAPRAGAFAVATAVGGDAIAFTNSGWEFSRQATRAQLGLDELLVLNDFEALALALPHLRAVQLRAIGPVQAGWPDATPRGTLAVIGPGTGLGVAGLLPTPHGWVAIPGEGGHASLAPVDDFEGELLRVVRREFAHVSAERLLSGIGLPVLHGAVAAVLGRPAAALGAGEIVERGLAGTDEVCSRSLDSFCALLGSFAGNVALVLGARGGVYIGGGIVPRLGERFFASDFRQRFDAKGRFQPYLQAIPTALITDTLVALAGAAAALETRALSTARPFRRR